MYGDGGAASRPSGVREYVVAAGVLPASRRVERPRRRAFIPLSGYGSWAPSRGLSGAWSRKASAARNIRRRLSGVRGTCGICVGRRGYSR